MDFEASISALFIYPIKSCAGVPVDAIEFDESGGAAGDRRWAVVNEDWEVTWQGAYPRLALVTPGLEATNIVLKAPGFEPIVTMPIAAMQPVVVKLWNEACTRNDEFAALDAGDSTAAWLAALVGAPLRLVRLSHEAVRRDTVNRLHVITAESVQAVNEESIGRGSAALDVRRFRPNIVLKGSGEPLPPFIEDHLLSLRVRNSQTEHRIDITAACVRCIVPNVDPHTAAVSNEPLNLLTELSAQRQPGGPTTFGVYGRSLNAGRIERHAMVALDLNF